MLERGSLEANLCYKRMRSFWESCHRGWDLGTFLWHLYNTTANRSAVAPQDQNSAEKLLFRFFGIDLVLCFLITSKKRKQYQKTYVHNSRHNWAKTNWKKTRNARQGRQVANCNELKSWFGVRTGNYFPYSHDFAASD